MLIFIVVKNNNKKIRCECWVKKIEKLRIEFVEIVSYNFNVCKYIHQYIA